MSEQNGANQPGVTPQDLLVMIGELTVENRLLRARLEQMQKETNEMEEAHASQ